MDPFDWLAWHPLPRRWHLWLPCALTRHRTGDGYCWCRGIIRFKIERGPHTWRAY